MGYWGIANGVVGTAHLADGAVTEPKIADGAVTGGHVKNAQWTWPANITVKHSGGVLCLDGYTEFCLEDGTFHIASGVPAFVYGTSYLYGSTYLYGDNYLYGADFIAGFDVVFSSVPCFLCGFYAYGRAYFGGSLVLPSSGNTCHGNGQLRWCSCNYKVEVYCNGSWYALH